MKKIKLYLPLIILATILVIAAIAVYKSNIKQNLGKENFLSGEKKLFLDKNYKLKDLYQKNGYLTFKDFINKKNRFSVVNIFASWCGSCIKEHKHLMDLSTNKSFNLYGIAWNDYHENTKKYLQKFGNPYQKVVLDSKGYLNKMLNISAVPETFIINSNGFIVYRHQGLIDKDLIDKIIRLH